MAASGGRQGCAGRGLARDAVEFGRQLLLAQRRLVRRRHRRRRGRGRVLVGPLASGALPVGLGAARPVRRVRACQLRPLRSA
jgi:hypothetical protein